MSDKGSDLDVFDGLAAKKSRPSAPVPPPPSGARSLPAPPPTAKKTLLGLAAPPPAPPTPSKVPPPPPPPPSKVGAAPPPQRPSAPPPPPPSKVSLPPPPPPPANVAAAPPPPAPSLAPPPPPPPAPPAPVAEASSSDDEKTPVPGKAPVAAAPIKPSAPPPPPPAPAKPVDIDWDDDDEATQIFDRGQEDASRSLLRSAPPPAAGAPPPPPPAAGTPLSKLPVPPAPPPASRQPTLHNRPAPTVPGPLSSRGPLPPPPVTAPAALSQPMHQPSMPDSALVQTMPQPQSRSGLWAAVGLLVAGAAAAIVYLFVLPKTGTIVVTVAGPGNKPVDAVEVWVDATKVCTQSPCRTPELTQGTHLVKVTAAGYTPTADMAVKVSAGDEAVHNVTLTRASDGTGIKVAAAGRGLKLSVDGKEIGPLPQEIRDMSPGTHTIKIDGSDRYETFEKEISVEADKMVSIEPKLKVKKGLATIKLGANAEDAKVLLVSGSERRPLPQLPITVDIQMDKPYTIVAEKKGVPSFSQKIEFDDGEAEKTFTIDMSAAEASADPVPASPTRSTGGGGAAKQSGGGAAAASGKGTLNINAIPVANVILDGRPLGSTPKSGVSVAPGPHTIVFVHPEHGRKVKTVNVEAGKTAAAVVRFP